jgi:hypothetical protein
MIVKCEFKADNNSYGFIKKEGDVTEELFRDTSSPLLDDCVKLVYPPKETGITVAVVTFRFMMESCPMCEGPLCAAATTDQMYEGRALSVIHCSENQQFAFVKGIPTSRSNNENDEV